jgi:hypothetical protein
MDDHYANDSCRLAINRTVLVIVLAIACLDICATSVSQSNTSRAFLQRIHSRTHKTPTRDSEFHHGLDIWTHKSKSSQDDNAQWSADGRALAVFFCRGNDRNRLLVWRKGKRVRGWNGSSFLAGEPAYKLAWSPDDRRLLIHIPPSEGSWDTHTGPLWCIDMRTGRHRLICGSATYFSWIGSYKIRYHYYVWDRPVPGGNQEQTRVVRVRK